MYLSTRSHHRRTIHVFYMMKSSNGNIIRVTSHLCVTGHFTGPFWDMNLTQRHTDMDSVLTIQKKAKDHSFRMSKHHR